MENLFEFFLKDSEKKFSGWDFSYVADTGRMVESPYSWSYTSRILKEFRKATTFLDMGTGGGEFLSKLQPLPLNSFATEGYEPNLAIATKRLEPLGVKVIKVNEDNKLTFEDNFFDLITNRHEEYSAKEVHRVLKQDGYFITQQVGGENCLELNRLLGYNKDFNMSNWNLKYAVSELEDVGFNIIEQYEDYPLLRFFDIGAIVYYLKAVPWQIADFSIEKYYDSLKELHNQIQNKGYIDIKEHRFFILAKK